MVYRYRIEMACSGCGLCCEACVVDAVIEEGPPFRIDEERCVRCGECYRVCPLDAITASPVPPAAPDVRPAP